MVASRVGNLGGLSPEVRRALLLQPSPSLVWGGGSGSGSFVGGRWVTEGGDYLVTESGDYINFL